MDTIKDRFRLISGHYGLSIRAFEERCGLLRGNISNMTGAIGSDKLAKIIDTFPEVDMIWLITGRGSMFKSGSPGQPCIEKVPTPPPEPSPPRTDHSDSHFDKVLRRNEELAVEVAMLKKEVDDLKISRGKGPRTISYGAHQEVGIVADPGAPAYSDRHRDK